MLSKNKSIYLQRNNKTSRSSPKAQLSQEKLMFVMFRSYETWEKTQSYLVINSCFIILCFFNPCFINPRFINPCFIKPCFINPCFIKPCFINPCFINPVHVLPIQSTSPVHMKAVSPALPNQQLRLVIEPLAQCHSI